MSRRIVTLGGGGVGKSCFTIQFIQNIFVNRFDPTIEDCYTKAIVVDEKQWILEIIDTAGQEDYVPMSHRHHLSADGFILMFSVTDRDSFEDIPSLFEEIERLRSDKQSYKVMVVGNKSDLDDERVVTTDEAMNLARDLQIPYIEASAKDGKNVEETFIQLVRLLQSCPMIPKQQTTATIEKRKVGCQIA